MNKNEPHSEITCFSPLNLLQDALKLHVFGRANSCKFELFCEGFSFVNLRGCEVS